MYSDVIYAELSRIINKSPQDITLIVHSRLSFNQVERLLLIRKVKSLIIQNASEEMDRVFQGRIGSRAEYGAEWLLPEFLARDVIYVGPKNTLGLRFAYALWMSGIKSVSFIFASPPYKKNYLLNVVFKAGISAIWYRSYTALLQNEKKSIFVYSLEKIVDSVGDFRLKSCLDKVRPLLKENNRTKFVSRRIIVVGSALGPGGAERQMALTIVGIKKRGYSDISFLHLFDLTEPNNFYLKYLIDNNVTYKKLDKLFICPDDDEKYYILEKIKVFENLTLEIIPYFKEFIKVKPEVVHIWQDQTGMHAGLAALMAGVPNIIISWRSLAPDNFKFNRMYMKTIYNFLASHSSVKFLNNSSIGADDYRRWLGNSSINIDVIYNGFDFSKLPETSVAQLKKEYLRKKLGLSKNTFIVGGVMRFTEEKRPTLFIEIASEILKNVTKAHFFIIGDGPLMANAVNYADKILSDNITFIGNTGDVYGYMMAFDLLMLTSRVEGLPNVLLEAQALGVPVISAKVGGVPEAVDENITGVFFDSIYPPKAGIQASKLLLDYEWRNNASIAGPKFVSSRFGMENMISDTLDSYKV